MRYVSSDQYSTLYRGGVPGPTAGVGQPLRFRQISFTAPQRFLCQLTFNGNTRQMSDLFDHLLVTGHLGAAARDSTCHSVAITLPCDEKTGVDQQARREWGKARSR